MPIHAPKILFFGVWTPKRDWSSSRPPKGTSLAGTALTCQFWYRSVHWCRRRNQKERKKARKKLTVANWVFSQTTHVDAAILSDMWSCMPGGLLEIILSFKFRHNRMNHFRDVGVEICHFLYLRPVAYITACTTVQAVIYHSRSTLNRRAMCAQET